MHLLTELFVHLYEVQVPNLKVRRSTIFKKKLAIRSVSEPPLKSLKESYLTVPKARNSTTNGSDDEDLEGMPLTPSKSFVSKSVNELLELK